MCFSLAAFNPAGAAGAHPRRPALRGQDLPRLLRGLVRRGQRRPSADIPVICIDGPTASGKGTLAPPWRRALGYHLLDSGALYRAGGLAAERRDGTRPTTKPGMADRLGELAATLPLRFEGDRMLLAART
jgi:3-phosphoshikimate 1-carboxyvinyltransferase